MEESLEEALMLALRSSPGSRPEHLAEAVGLPRTNFGRRLKTRVRQPLDRLTDAGLVRESRGRYQLTAAGRKSLSTRFDSTP